MIQKYFQNELTWWKNQYNTIRLRSIKKKHRTDFPLPKVVHPYHQNIAIRQRKILSMFAITIIIAGIYSFFYVQQKIKANDLVSVWVMKFDKNAPETVTKSDLILEQFPRKTLPIGFFSVWKEEKTLIRDVGAREILTQKDFSVQGNEKSISTRFNQAYAFSIDEDWFESKIPSVYHHDRVDILSGNPAGVTAGISVLVEYGEVLKVRTNNSKKSIVLNLTKAQSESLLFARGLRLPLQLIVYPSDSKKPKKSEEKLEQKPKDTTLIEQ